MRTYRDFLPEATEDLGVFAVLLVDTGRGDHGPCRRDRTRHASNTNASFVVTSTARGNSFPNRTDPRGSFPVSIEE